MRARMSARSLGHYGITLTLSVLAGCGGGGNSQTNNQVTSSSEFLYASGQNEQVVGFTIDPSSGSLTGPMITLGPSTASAVSATLTIDPAAKHVFVYDTQNAAIVAFSIDPTSGALTAVSGSPFQLHTPGAPGGLAANPANDFLYVANFTGIEGFDINGSSGSLNLLSGSPFTGTNFPFALTFSPSGGFLYASGSNSIAGFAANSTNGTLTAVPGSPFQLPETQSTYLSIVHTSGKFLFSSNGVGIITWAIDPETGALTSTGSSAIAEGLDSPTDMVMDPAGQLLFVCDGLHALIATFSIDPGTGTLTLLNASQSNLQFIPQEILVDSSGNFLYVASQFGVESFQINSSTGALTPISNVPLTNQTELSFPSTLVMAR